MLYEMFQQFHKENCHHTENHLSAQECAAYISPAEVAKLPGDFAGACVEECGPACPESSLCKGATKLLNYFILVLIFTHSISVSSS